MPSRLRSGSCGPSAARGATNDGYFLGSFGKLLTLPTPPARAAEDCVVTSQGKASCSRDRKCVINTTRELTTPLSSYDESAQLQQRQQRRGKCVKMVRFETVEDDNCANEQIASQNGMEAFAEPLYATVRKRNSPERELQRPGNMPAAKEGFRPYRSMRHSNSGQPAVIARQQQQQHTWHVRQNTEIWSSGYKGELCPELAEKRLQLLENRYNNNNSSRLTAHQAAAVIQRGWRAYCLRRQFGRMVSIAKQADCDGKSRRRRSIFETSMLSDDSDIAVNVDSGDIVGLLGTKLTVTEGASSGAAARHINNRRVIRGPANEQSTSLVRSTSLRDNHRRSGSWSGFEPIQRSDDEEEEENELAGVKDDHCDCQSTGCSAKPSVGGGRYLKPSGSWTEGGRLRRPQTAADVQNNINMGLENGGGGNRLYISSPSPQASPVPPCPPLRGEEFYPGAVAEQPPPVYQQLARDSLYCSVRRPRRPLPPRPPQRTVSFLGPPEPSQQQPTNHPVTKSTSALPPIQCSPLPLQQQQGGRPLSTECSHHHQSSDLCSSLYATTGSSHSRSVSSPAESTSSPYCYERIRRQQQMSPLPPPPPYIPPPGLQRTEVEPPLPTPPPPPVVQKPDDSKVNPLRPPCDSVSSIDSGFRSSSCSDSTTSSQEEVGATTGSGPTSPHQEEEEEEMLMVPEDPYSYWVNSPQFLTSPDSARFYRATLGSGPVATTAPSQYHYQPNYHYQQQQLPYQAVGHAPSCCCQSGAHAAPPPPVYETYQDLYAMVRQQQHQQQLTHNDSAKSKKTVRIQLPMPSNNSSEMLEPVLPRPSATTTTATAGDDETIRRRNYRVGLNIFNMNPERGIEYLMRKDFIEPRSSPAAVAKFLAGRKGLSRRMVGEYICNLQKPFNMAVLAALIFDMDFAGLHLDIALRQLLTEIHIPGEAQKIEKLVEVFARRYIECNQMFVAGFRSPDTIFVLAYAMVLLNTDLHNGSIKPERKMRQEDFVRNLRGIDAGVDVDAEMLRGIYDRIRASEFRQAPDHVSQVSRVEESITGANKRPKLSAAAWRRLVCFCRVTEVTDINKKEKKDVHQRGLFLFNDLLVVTKAEKGASGRKSKAGSGQVHGHRYSLGLADLRVNMFRTQQHQFGVQLQERHTGRIAATFACRSYNDQQRFVGDLQESIAETEEMERARVFM